MVEDDHLLNSTLCYNLSAGGYKIDSAKTKQKQSNAVKNRHMNWPFWISISRMETGLHYARS